MGVFKIKPGDLMRGAKIDWTSVALRDNPGAAMPVRHADKRSAEPVRYPTMDKAGLADFQAQGNGEAGLSAKEPNQKQYEKIATARAEGNLPEQVAKTPVDRTQRGAVDEDNITGPTRQARVNRLAGTIQSDKTAAVPNADGDNEGLLQTDASVTMRGTGGYDRMLELLKAQQALDADADKRARRREMIAAIGDGISAISSLYQTTKGAPVTYTPGKDMSEVMRQRYDRYMAQRKADEDKYLNYLKVQAARDNAAIETQYKTRRLAADEAKEERENRRLDEIERHNRELEKYYSTKEQNSKEAKAAEQERKDKDSENKRENNNKRTESYVAAQGRKGSGSSKSKKGKQKKVAPKRKQRQNASKQGGTSSGNTMPGVS